MRFLRGVFRTLDDVQRWATSLVQELESLADQVTRLQEKLPRGTSGMVFNEHQALVLRRYPVASAGTPGQSYADSLVELRDGAIYLFDGDPTGGTGGQGLYMWDAATTTWIKV
ncbi:hypothetical protein D6833_12500 [Candidatus Parcubacteria bacterium]|nr:MAG: hypothetical protein D6833_12500 [Candidatus Parcubacteria bacterium]